MPPTTTQPSPNTSELNVRGNRVEVRIQENDAPLRRFHFTTSAKLRDDLPPGGTFEVAEEPEAPAVQGGSLLFDGLFALAVSEARQNSVDAIRDGSYRDGRPIPLKAFETGEKWHYVWTRDLAYALDLGLAAVDPPRARESLLFKTSELKSAVAGGLSPQIIQDTGSGGSYPVSTDRTVWALGAEATLLHLPTAERNSFLDQVYAVLRATIEQDRRLVFDPEDGLYRGEQSFLDWREQTYPVWTRNRVLPIALSKALSVNVGMFFLLDRAREYGEALGRDDEARRYGDWSSELREAIQDRFWDEEAGLYRTYLFTENGTRPMQVARYDLLGLCHAIRFGIATPEQTRRILESYPTGPYGPPVVWPQEPEVEIYHNAGIWPFVTAYWTRAGRDANHPGVVESGLRSLMEGAALNLSNMENFDFLSGRAEATYPERWGPVVNSRRQLWSAAGYLGTITDILFGLDVDRHGIAFRPSMTAAIQKLVAGSENSLTLRNLHILGNRHEVTVHLPAQMNEGSEGFFGIEDVQLNGERLRTRSVAHESLASDNRWDIRLGAPASASIPPSLRTVRVDRERELFTPPVPSGLALKAGPKEGTIQLSWDAPEQSHFQFRLYRDGRLLQDGLESTSFIDKLTSGKTAEYCLTMRDSESGLESHPTPLVRWNGAMPPGLFRMDHWKSTGSATAREGILTGWGNPDDRLEGTFSVDCNGRFRLRWQYRNPYGPINTGISCGIKRMRILEPDETLHASGYLIFPHTGESPEVFYSSGLIIALASGIPYRLVLDEDETCRNMSYFERNTDYTGGRGGGPLPFNQIHLHALETLYETS